MKKLLLLVVVAVLIASFVFAGRSSETAPSGSTMTWVMKESGDIITAGGSTVLPPPER